MKVSGARSVGGVTQAGAWLVYNLSGGKGAAAPPGSPWREVERCIKRGGGGAEASL